VRLDHLLSREFRAGTLGVVPALKAPRLIARSLAFPARWGASTSSLVEIDRDLANTPKPLGHSEPEFLSLFTC